MIARVMLHSKHFSLSSGVVLVPPLHDATYNIITNLQLFIMDILYLAQP